MMGEEPVDYHTSAVCRVVRRCDWSFWLTAYGRGDIDPPSHPDSVGGFTRGESAGQRFINLSAYDIDVSPHRSFVAGSMPRQVYADWLEENLSSKGIPFPAEVLALLRM